MKKEKIISKFGHEAYKINTILVDTPENRDAELDNHVKELFNSEPKNDSSRRISHVLRSSNKYDNYEEPDMIDNNESEFNNDTGLEHKLNKNNFAVNLNRFKIDKPSDSGGGQGPGDGSQSSRGKDFIGATGERVTPLVIAQILSNDKKEELKKAKADKKINSSKGNSSTPDRRRPNRNSKTPEPDFRGGNETERHLITEPPSDIESSKFRSSHFNRGDDRKGTINSNMTGTNRRRNGKRTKTYLQKTLINSIQRIQARFRVGNRSNTTLSKKSKVTNKNLDIQESIKKAKEHRKQANFVNTMEGVMGMFQKSHQRAKNVILSKQDNTPKLGGAMDKELKISKFKKRAVDEELQHSAE